MLVRRDLLRQVTHGVKWWISLQRQESWYNNNSNRLVMLNPICDQHRDWCCGRQEKTTSGRCAQHSTTFYKLPNVLNSTEVVWACISWFVVTSLPRGQVMNFIRTITIKVEIDVVVDERKWLQERCTQRSTTFCKLPKVLNSTDVTAQIHR